jgi:DNA polymerase III subunit gamma/tau
MGKALYRKYRSKSLEEVIGQKHVTDILARSLKQGRIAHAYLLTGPRGVGKTSIARILAHEINQLPYSEESTHLDIIEIDAASNNGVDDVRDLREKVQIAPVSAAKKVYIIDEVHMLSKPAFNALLKTLEEPPEHVVFILATTDADKLPATIISRTQRFGFRSINRVDAIAHLKTIADKEKIKIDDESLAIIADRGDGSFRDSISLLDQLSSLADQKAGITKDLVESTLGLAPNESVTALLDAIKSHDSTAIITLLDEFEQSGIQTTVLTSQLITSIRIRIGEHPQLIGLLDTLLDVNKSSHPAVKLLTVLMNYATPKTTKSIALAAPLPTISAPIAELKKPVSPKTNTSHTPVEQRVVTSGAAPAFADAKSGAKEGASSSTGPASAAEPESKQKPTKPKTLGTFNWDTYLEYTRTNHVAIYSVLSKCSYELDDETLNLYTGTPFYKKKLDDAKYRPFLFTALLETGAGDWTIETIPTPAPPKDSVAAAVADIMGGGEEVSMAE